jgi:hypothetical protein
MRALPTESRRTLERAVLEGRRAAEAGARAALASLGVAAREKPAHLSGAQARLRRGLRAKQRQLGGGFELLVWECAYEQWHRLLFARYLAENGLLRHPVYEAPVTLGECEELAEELGEPDGWSVAARFASEILPGIFRLDDPTVQIRLAAEHRVALEEIVAGLPVEVFLADDSLGWVYQYWQSERKDQVNASEVKIGGADLSPVTQLFTENYMVRFLLENSLGAWWAARRPGSPLVKEFEFLRFDDDGRPAAGTFDGWPATVAEITVIDPCCGSGHFLVEAFGMLWRMRVEEEGLDPLAAQDAVLRDNLFGLELDPRCVQIAMFAVALTAWKEGGGWRLLPTPNIACSGIPAKAPLEEWTALAEGDDRLERALERLHALFKDADTLGSLIDPRRAAEMVNAAKSQRSFDDVDFDEIAPLLEKAAARETNDPATAVLGADAAGIARAATLLSHTYTLIATNPPFLGRGKQSVLLRDQLSQVFSEGQQDLATAFLVRGTRLLNAAGTLAFVTPHNWYVQPTYTQLRARMLEVGHLVGSAILGEEAFDSFGIRGPRTVLVLWSLARNSPNPGRMGWAVDASSIPGQVQVLIPQKIDRLMHSDLAYVPIEDQIRRPSHRILFGEDAGTAHLRSVADSFQGLKTGDDPRYRRFFWEVSFAEPRWRGAQGSPLERGASGRHYALEWSRAGAHLARLQGLAAWGRSGVAVGRTRSLSVAAYHGDPFFSEVVAIVPRNENDLDVVRAFAFSGQLETLVRQIDGATILSNDTFLDVPFSPGDWNEKGEADSDGGRDGARPTQWLFEGRPEVATEPLQVGVGRLVGYQWPEQPADDGLDSHKDVDGIVCLPAVGGEAPAVDRLRSLLADAYGEAWSPGLAGKLLEQAGSKKKTVADWLRDDFFKHHCKVFGNRPFVWHIWDGRKDGFAALVNYHRLDRSGLEKLTYTYLGDWIERQRAGAADEVAGADLRLAAALALRGKLEAILEGEPPFDTYVRWKSLAEQPIGWDPDLDDGVRLNIRPFVEAGMLRSKMNVHWRKDRGKNPDGSGRHNDLHYANAEKQQARREAGKP